MAHAQCVDFDGDGHPDTCGSGGGVPEVNGPSAVDTEYSSGSTSSSTKAQASSSQRTVHQSSSASMSNMVTTTVFGSLLEAVFSAPAAPSGPTPEEIEAQRQLEEKKRQEFERSKASLVGKLKGGAAPSYVKDNAIMETDGALKLKTIPAPGSAAAAGTSGAGGEIHKDLFGSGPTDVKTVQLLREPILDQGTVAGTDAWRQAVNRSDLTQEERERLVLQSKVGRTALADHPMIDVRARVEKERQTNLYLDVASAAGKGALQSVAGASLEDAGKRVLEKAGGTSAGFDALLTAGKIGSSQTTAEKVVSAGDYALTKVPGWGTVAEGAAGAVGAGARQAVVRYWASRDSRQMYDPTPVATAKDKWNTWVSDQNDWTKAALDRVGAGEFGK